MPKPRARQTSHKKKLPQLGASPLVFTSLTPAKTTEVYDAYWTFAHERQLVYMRRVLGAPPPWTSDPILVRHKFTNAYRAADRVSQYLIRNVIYAGDPSIDEVVFRLLLFKLFNKIETWEALSKEIGELRYDSFSLRLYSRVLDERFASGTTIYSAAYIMASGRSLYGYSRKHHTHLRLLAEMMSSGLPARLAEAGSLRDVFLVLRSYPLLGDFLAYQLAIDLNYTDLFQFDEMEFVAAGPGALDGLSKCFSDFGGLSAPDLIRLVTDRQELEFERLHLPFVGLWGRPLQLIDCQNLFCEVSKYSRVSHPHIDGVAGRTRIKQKFVPTGSLPTPWFPPKWGINSSVQKMDE